jgi:RimJ/RimL family protein N-acetyltransferase
LHLERSRAWRNDAALMRLMDQTQPVDPHEHERWFSALQTRVDCVYQAVETVDDGRHVGNVWLWNIDRRHGKAELSIVIGEPGLSGIGTEAIAQMSAHAFTKLALHKVYAHVLAINPRALRAFQKAGFVLEGTLAADRRTSEGFTDVFLLGMLSPGSGS